jgi:hypothetical protein
MPFAWSPPTRPSESASAGAAVNTGPSGFVRPVFSRTALDSAGQVGAGGSLAIGVDGLELISYLDWTNSDLRMAHCSDIACTTATTTTLDNAGTGYAYGTSLVIGVDGLGLISYYESISDDLRVAHCADRFCVPYVRPR